MLFITAERKSSDMKVLISDYPDSMHRDISREISLLKSSPVISDVDVYPYTSYSAFCSHLSDADGLITAFLPITETVLNEASKLKCISINATGYDTVDLSAAAAKNIDVCPIREYCTQEVAEFTVTLLLSLVKKIKLHEYAIEHDHIWQYQAAGAVRPLAGSTLAVFGYGRIGRAVARLASAFGIDVIAVADHIPADTSGTGPAKIVSARFAAENADFISNHMNASDKNHHYFSGDFFSGLRKHPIFINTARGSCVDEAALVHALDAGLISAAGLDVLESECPDLISNPLLNRSNVIITPHAAFYSEQSIKKLQEISCMNMISCLEARSSEISR